MNLEIHVSLRKSEINAYGKLCKGYGYDASKITETLIKNFIQRAALTKFEDKRVSQEAYEMQLKHNSKGRM